MRVRGPEPRVIVDHLRIGVARLAKAMVFISTLEAVDIDDAHSLKILGSVFDDFIHAESQAIKLSAKVGGQLWRGPTPIIPGDVVAVSVLLVEKCHIAGHIDLEAFSRIGTTSLSSCLSDMEQAGVNLVPKTAIIKALREII